MSLHFEISDFNEYLEKTGEVGYVRYINMPIVRVEGLPSVKANSLVIFETGAAGIIISIDVAFVDVLLLDDSSIKVGSQVTSTGLPLLVEASTNLLGSYINPYGQQIMKIDDSNEISTDKSMRDIHGKVMPIFDRAIIKDRFYTGVSVVDLLLPLGKGQRQLIIGDRKTGKTEFLLQLLLEQANTNVICIYACIGKRHDDINRVLSFAKENSMSNIVIVGTFSSDPLGDIYITPYSAMTIAEHFRDLGKDVVIVLDDLTTHAKFYREMSLLSGRFPGRSSYPGDIFYIHSRLLERGGNFLINGKKGSITSFPVADSPAGDITGYIQTNLMSITDGHLFFDNDLFEKGRRPAINYFLSVTRVGRQTQNKLMWSINRELTSFLSLLERTQEFVHFGAEINEGIKATLTMGDKILTFLNQRLGTTRILNTQLIVFCLIWSGIYAEDIHGHLSEVLEKLDVLYKTDNDFKKIIDSYVDSSEDLNMLLAKVTSSSAKILKYVE